MRRTPLQARGHRRVDLLLDAAAEIVAEVGVKAATTNAIAARAKTSVGSLYQFFPDKHALVQALAQRLVDRGIEANQRNVWPADPAEWSISEMVERGVRSWAAFIDKNPAYPDVARTVQAAGAFGTSEFLSAAVVSVENKLKLLKPKVPPRDRRIHAVMVAETMNTMLCRGAEMARPDRERLMRELILMMVRYLAPIYANPGIV
ncbi:MAG: TetR/AcrR family transcriptional regulator [Gemmatimonadaceae bacterium]